MHTTSSRTPPPQPDRPRGRGGPLIIGGAAFLIVFLLIVAGTVGYLVLRGSGNGPSSAPTATDASAAPPSDAVPPGSDGPESEAPADEETCYRPPQERTSSNPAGKLRGGGLEVIPPAAYVDRPSANYADFVTDSQLASAPVEASWVSTILVGEVQWQDGVDYPGDAEASERIFDCLVDNDSMWGDTSGRTLQDRTTDPVTIAGMGGYKTEGVLDLGENDLETTNATEIVVVVVSTPDGPSAYISETAVGVEEHEEGAQAAFDSLTGLTG